jgi:hypothetical protein
MRERELTTLINGMMKNPLVGVSFWGDLFFK